ncbi:hypothetical protein TorRG33x02_332780 [Trema orientale]|uniref:Uncharacterized protein n=1 Tax=Trema orientale TaxID=63057 RepID=A0A2P5B4Y9_TREOI|nr:hypothetical protein TorRG33x02_332780 [Trema orientale]
MGSYRAVVDPKTETVEGDDWVWLPDLLLGSSGSGLGSRVLPSSLMVNARKDENNNRSVKDHEDLTLFREMNNRNRDKDGVISLLHPLSDEFDHSLIPLPSNPNGTPSFMIHRSLLTSLYN